MITQQVDNLITAHAALQAENDRLRAEVQRLRALLKELLDYLEAWQHNSLEPTYSDTLMTAIRAALEPQS